MIRTLKTNTQHYGCYYMRKYCSRPQVYTYIYLLPSEFVRVFVVTTFSASSRQILKNYAVNLVEKVCCVQCFVNALAPLRKICAICICIYGCENANIFGTNKQQQQQKPVAMWYIRSVVKDLRAHVCVYGGFRRDLLNCTGNVGLNVADECNAEAYVRY